MCFIFFNTFCFIKAKRQIFHNKSLLDFNRTFFLLQFSCRGAYLEKRVKEHFEDIAGFLVHKKMENLREIEK